MDQRIGRQEKRKGMLGTWIGVMTMKKSKKWLHPKILCPENTLKVKSIGFADVLDVGYERKRRFRFDSKNFDLSNWNTIRNF